MSTDVVGSLETAVHTKQRAIDLHREAIERDMAQRLEALSAEEAKLGDLAILKEQLPEARWHRDRNGQRELIIDRSSEPTEYRFTTTQWQTWNDHDEYVELELYRPVEAGSSTFDVLTGIPLQVGREQRDEYGENLEFTFDYEHLPKNEFINVLQESGAPRALAERIVEELIENYPELENQFELAELE